MSRKPRNQKLTNSQIRTLKHLRDNGVQISVIAKVLHNSYGLSICVAYYHLSPNRQSYEYKARRDKTVDTLTLKEKIQSMIQLGYTTRDYAKDNNMSLEEVNKIYSN